MDADKKLVLAFICAICVICGPAFARVDHIDVTSREWDLANRE